MLRAIGLFIMIAFSTLAERRAVPFWPAAVPEAIHAHVDGVAVLETVRQLGRFHRVQGSPGFAGAAEYLEKRLMDAGLSEVRIEKFPADGKTAYAHFRSYYGWSPLEATLEEMSPRRRVMASFPLNPVALADYSQDAEVTAEVVDVGAGTAAQDYEGKTVREKIALAGGTLPEVHRQACLERGALGFLSDYPNQTTAWSGDDRDLVRWGHLSPYETRNRFAFMLSKRQAEELRARLRAGERIVVRARVRAKMTPATYDVVVATIRGAEKPEEEVIFTAHLCHQSAGANDNASGSAAILEVARALQAAISGGFLPPPRRTLRFLWLPEIAGSQAYLIRHPGLARRAVGGVHMDMVGGLLSTIRGAFHLSRTAASRPHAINAIAEAWFEHLVAASMRYAERGGDPYGGFVWPPGSREMFVGDVREIELGSDHQVFQEGSYGIPMVYFHDWPDVTIHTNKDQPENLDATKLGRVAYLGAGIAWTLAALPDAEAPRLAAVVRAAAEKRLAEARLRSLEAEDPRDGALALREAVAMGAAEMRSVAQLWPGAAAAAREMETALASQRPVTPAPARPDPRAPARSPEVMGPLDVYYYRHLDHALETGAPRAELGELLAYEALNLADGSRSVSEIRDILSGRYAPVEVEKVAAYFEMLVRAKVIDWRRPAR